MAAAAMAAASRLGTASSRGKESRRPTLEEQDHEHENRDLREDRAERRLDPLVESADSGRRQNRAGELPHATGDDDHEGVDDVVLAERGPDIADLRERGARETRQPGAERERRGIDPAGTDAEARRHPAILG